MLSKCFHSTCPAPFRYLHEGRIFNIEVTTPSPDPDGVPTHKVELFWLCRQCAQTLRIVRENGVVTTRPLHLELSPGSPREKAPEREMEAA